MAIATGEGGQPGGAEAAPALPRHLAALERAHAIALRVGRALEAAPATRADLRPIAAGVEAVLASLYDAYDRRSDPLGATREAMDGFDRAATLIDGAKAYDPGLGELPGMLREARQVLAIAEERFGRAQEPPPVPVELRASIDLPAVHWVERSSLGPRLRVVDPLPPPDAPPEPLPPPKTFEELEARLGELQARAAKRREVSEDKRRARAQARAVAAAHPAALEPPPGFVPGSHQAISRGDLVRRRTRDAFEEVAMIGVQRAPLLGDPWRHAAVLEKRMLAAVDAIASLGPTAVAHLESLVADSPAKDPSRGFAAALIGGSLHGRDALGVVERVLHALGPGDPEVMRQVSGALKLAPHPDLPHMLRGWLQDSDAPLRAMAIDVLGYRGWARPDEVAAGSSDAATLVRAHALPYAGTTRHPLLAELASPCLDHEEPSLREAAWAALAFGSHPSAAAGPARALSSGSTSAALALAIAGDREHAEDLLQSFLKEPGRHLAVALGWAGLVTAVPPLIEGLVTKDADVALSHAFALMRITGAELFEDVDLPPEKVDVPDVDEPAIAAEPKPPPLATVVSDPRDVPSDGSPDLMRLPTVRPDRWRGYWRQLGPRFEPTLRYRRGRPYTPLVSLRELDDYLLTPPERRWLQRELVVRTGRFVRFDPHDFVPVQEAALAEWAGPARSASSTPGAWLQPSPRAG